MTDIAGSAKFHCHECHEPKGENISNIREKRTENQMAQSGTPKDVEPSVNTNVEENQEDSIINNTNASPKKREEPFPTLLKMTAEQESFRSTQRCRRASPVLVATPSTKADTSTSPTLSDADVGSADVDSNNPVSPIRHHGRGGGQSFSTESTPTPQRVISVAAKKKPQSPLVLPIPCLRFQEVLFF